MRYPIEIKVNIDGGVAQALAALGQPPPATKRLIWFAEDREGLAAGELRLQSAGVIVRVRSGEGPDDSTVKLRPYRPSQLRADWASKFDGDHPQYRIEGDWSGQRRLQAASAVSTFGQGSRAQEGDGAPLEPDALTTDQLRFLRDCADVPVDVGRLVALGPIDSTKWNDVPLAGMKVDMERWVVAGLDFLELSIRVKPKDGQTKTDVKARAEKRQAELAAAVTAAGLQIAVDNDNKTHRVLTALASAPVP